MVPNPNEPMKTAFKLILYSPDKCLSYNPINNATVSILTDRSRSQIRAPTFILPDSSALIIDAMLTTVKKPVIQMIVMRT